MKLALHYEMARPVLDDHLLLEETMEQIIFADEVGFDYVWLVEHHFLTGFSGCPANDIIYGALSQRTKQIRLGLGVIVLPMHHPVQVAERVAVLDHLAEGRVDFGTGRSAIYELEGMGLDARDSRSMWDESLTMVPKIWGTDWFSWEGKHWSVPSRQVLPKPYQDPHPPIWVAALQPATYRIAAEKGIGVLAMGASDPTVLEPHIKEFHETPASIPVGSSVNKQWGSQTIGICTEDDNEAREMATRSIKNFYGPERPYAKSQADLYSKLIRQWGGLPDHQVRDFGRTVDLEGIKVPDSDTPDFITQKLWEDLDADTLCDRAVIIAGDPEGCVRGLKKHEAAGVDQMLISMQTDTVPHEVVMKSIDLYGKHVIPEFK